MSDSKPPLSADSLIDSASSRPERLKQSALSNDLAAAKKEVRELTEALHAKEAQLEIFSALDAMGPPSVIERRERTSGLREATAFVMASDWHVGERVRQETVNGRNEFNVDVARRRIAKMAQGVEWLVAKNRDSGPGNTRYQIRDVVLCLLGDIITGWLHQDQQVTNTLLPIPEVLEAFDLVASLIDYILEHVQPETLTITGNYGNHGRTTKKTLNNAQAECNLEFLIYNFLVRRYEGDPRVRFDLCAGKLLYLDVYDFTVRMSHGDDCNYGGGIGGITIPINKAVFSWNTQRHADIDLMGHWHQYTSLPSLVVNGSVIGYSPYSIRIRAPFEAPTQSFFLIEPGRGKRADDRIFLEPAQP